MKLTVSNEGTTHIIAIEGWLDTKTSTELAEQLEKVPEDAGELILDVKEMEYISSAGLRQIVTAYKQMNGHMKIRGIRPEILDVMKMAGLDKKFTFED
ncbi:MAG: STAS domain-containing protein [Eubacterium sp.]|nr:STAS domain-containing protein [Eubacterium sp.]